MKKVCKNCKIEKDYEDYSVNKRLLTGRSSMCRKCYHIKYQLTEKGRKQADDYRKSKMGKLVRLFNLMKQSNVYFSHYMPPKSGEPKTYQYTPEEIDALLKPYAPTVTVTFNNGMYKASGGGKTGHISNYEDDARALLLFEFGSYGNPREIDYEE